ncbi:sugar phosphate nucleotidyltransferase [Breoghania sp. L-A4]|uniref:sugar phosphate nucleotidyltransferase n=1 Tax=Breoghania sp. L-A4 TaxID=2304600 RepID=UPI0032046B5B
MIHPCILSGGSGSRLWPLSRKAYPKQFLQIFDGESLFQKTCRRVGDAQRFAKPIVIANQDHRFLVGEQLSEHGLAADRIILEPMGRNTAAPPPSPRLWWARRMWTGWSCCCPPIT